MTVLSAQSIRERIQGEFKLLGLMPPGDWRLHVEPFEPEAKQYKGKSYGLTAAGYDIRLGKLRHPRRDNIVVESLHLRPGEFMLAASLEWVQVPTDLQVIVHDKSTWARRGLALQNTVLEPGWFGHITLELSNHGPKTLEISSGMPIAQLIFHELDKPTDRPYKGKYQDQGAEPVEAIYERGEEVQPSITDNWDGATDAQ